MTCPDCGSELRSATAPCPCGYDPRSRARPSLKVKDHGDPHERIEILRRRISRLETHSCLLWVVALPALVLGALGVLHALFGQHP